jgi:predicted membrane metal-binding protein
MEVQGLLPNKQGPFLASAVILAGFDCNLLACWLVDWLESEYA